MPVEQPATIERGTTEVARRLQDVEVVDFHTGAKLRLGDMWDPASARGPVLLCMFRRWGCALCRMSAAQFSALKPYFDEKGVRMVGLGVERVGFEEFQSGGFFAGELYVDEARGAYTALACVKNSWRNLWGLLNDDVTRLIKLTKKRGFDGNLTGNKNQLGGTFLIEPGGRLLYGHYQTVKSFEPQFYELMDALQVKLPNGFDPYEVTPPH